VLAGEPSSPTKIIADPLSPALRFGFEMSLAWGAGPTLYWKMTLKVVNGGATMSVAEITQQEYKDAQKKHDAATGAIGGSGGSWPSAGGSKTLRP